MRPSKMGGNYGDSQLVQAIKAWNATSVQASQKA